MPSSKKAKIDRATSKDTAVERALKKRKRNIAKHLAAAEENIKQGRVHGPFTTTEELFAAARNFQTSETTTRRKK
ncbi:MAG: hypothetical protein AAB343_01355 [Patescibacteria group bacterium]